MSKAAKALVGLTTLIAGTYGGSFTFLVVLNVAPRSVQNAVSLIGMLVVIGFVSVILTERGREAVKKKLGSKT